jgi:hypothetical protein
VAARTVLLEDTLAVVLRRTDLLSNRIFVWLGLWLAALLSAKRQY